MRLEFQYKELKFYLELIYIYSFYTVFTHLEHESPMLLVWGYTYMNMFVKIELRTKEVGQKHANLNI